MFFWGHSVESIVWLEWFEGEDCSCDTDLGRTAELVAHWRHFSKCAVIPL